MPAPASDFVRYFMTCFLTSRMDDPNTGELNPANHFVDELRRYIPNPCRALHVCSDPDSWDIMDKYTAITRAMLENAGFRFERFDTLDSRNENLAEQLVRGSDLLILAGGHVPTQNQFFQRISLRALLANCDGIIIGISAGSMNSADEVYAQPEEEGEAVDPAYQRFLPGLGLTKTNLLPHYQENRDDVLDGLRIYADIACSDSMGKTFYAIPDGTYLLIADGKEELRGEAYRIKDGVMAQISSLGDVVSL